MAAYGKVLPAVNQVEANVFSQQQTLDELLHHFDTRIMAWAPLSQGGEGLFDNELLTSLAQRHHKTVAQIALRWLIQRGCIAIPKTVRKERMQENFDVFDFRLSDEEMFQIAASIARTPAHAISTIPNSSNASSPSPSEPRTLRCDATPSNGRFHSFFSPETSADEKQRFGNDTRL